MICLLSETALGPVILGINLIWVELIENGRLPSEKNSYISFVIAGPTMSQFDWKKLAEKPSGLGALSGWMENMASLTSRWVGGAMRISFAASEMHGDTS